MERAAVAALESLTVKLSERAFKPLFLRLVEWARATLPAAPGAPICNQTQATLFNSKTELRTPHRSFNDDAIRLLQPAPQHCALPAMLLPTFEGGCWKWRRAGITHTFCDLNMTDPMLDGFA